MAGNGVDQPLGNRKRQINSYPLVIEAACKNQGVALGWRYLVDDLIRQGRLLRPIEQSLVTESGYYLLCREGQQQDENVMRLHDWLLQQFEAGKCLS